MSSTESKTLRVTLPKRHVYRLLLSQFEYLLPELVSMLPGGELTVTFAIVVIAEYEIPVIYTARTIERFRSQHISGPGVLSGVL